MEFKQIKYFIAAAETKSISRAARMLSISQPTLSIALKKLEEEVGAELISRKGKGFELSPAGEAFLKRVEPAVREIEAAVDIARRTSMQQWYTVAFAALSFNTHWELVKSIAGFDANVEFLPIVRQTFEMLAQKLNSRVYDLCISAPPVSGPGLVRRTIHNRELYAIVPADHRLAGRKSINLSELAYDKFAMPQENTPYYGRTMELCRLAGFSPNVGYSFVSLSDAYLSVQKGGYVSLLGLPGESKELLNNVKVLRIAYPECRAVLGIAWREESAEDEKMMEMVEAVAKHFSTIRER